MFECIKCGLLFEPKGFETTGTFYTLCKDCGERVLNEGRCKMTNKYKSACMKDYWKTIHWIMERYSITVQEAREKMRIKIEGSELTLREAREGEKKRHITK